MLSKKIIRYSMLMAILSIPAVGFADDTVTGIPPQDTSRNAGNGASNTGMQPGDMSKEAQKQALLSRASKLIGTNIYNDAGESLGEINELVLEGSENRIGYAVLSFGGVMGIGDKLFAIPWRQFQHKGTDKDKLYLAVAKDTLKNAPGFDKKQWPDSADRSYWQSVDKFYPRDAVLHADPTGTGHTGTGHTGTGDTGTDATRTADGTAGGMAPQPDRPVADATNPQAGGINTPVDPNRSATNLPAGKVAWSRRVSSVIGADIQNATNENLGDVKDLVIDSTTGRVRYAVVSFGGWLGMGDKLFAVPMNALQGDSAREYFVMNVSKDQMKNAPGFDQKAWPDFASPQWGATNDAFYGGDGKTGSQAARTE